MAIHIKKIRTLANGKSTAVAVTSAFCEEMRQLSPLLINFPRRRQQTSEKIQNFKYGTDCISVGWNN